MSYTNFTDSKGLAKGCPFYFHECPLNPVSVSLLIGLTSHGASGIEYEYCEVFEQYKKAHYLCLSSLNRNGYYIDGGLSDEYSSLSSVTQVIKDIIAAYSITNLILVGEGSAGTGAIFYGWDLSKLYTTSIIAFAPYNNLPTANWNLVKDICSLDPNPPHKNHFKILADPDPKFSNETIRFSGLSTYLDVQESEGGQHLAKSSYLRGDLFKLFDEEIAATDLMEIDYGQLTQKIWDSPRLVNHAEEIAAGGGAAGTEHPKLEIDTWGISNGASNIPVNSRFSFIFKENINIGSGEIIFEDPDNPDNNRTFDVTSDAIEVQDDTVTIDLSKQPLASGVRYTVTISPNTFVTQEDAILYKGYAGNIDTYSFTTA